ncbi:MAG: S-layer homology domain-containing protein [Acutalibacter muris]|nr:S-layer homology domain-containing protein [Acutalibacter muris]
MISDWTGVTDATKTENTHDIKDWNKINWGKHYVNSVYDAGFMQGRTNGNFGPQDVLKRSEAAVVIMKAYEYMADK